MEQFQAAFKACQDQKDGYEFQARQALSQILLFLKERSKESKPPLSKCRAQRLKTMISWLDAHYREPVTIGQLAFSVRLCARECQKLFSELLHISPMQYLARRCIAAAARLLEYRDLPISQIAMDCGFESPSYFASQFRKMAGMSPREYRRQKI